MQAIKWVLLLMVLMAQVGHAETIPATWQTPEYPLMFYRPAVPNPAKFSTPSGVCYGAMNCGGTISWANIGQYGRCQCNGWDQFDVSPGCGTGNMQGSYPNYKCVGNPAWACPTSGGWTLSGSNCTRPDCTPGTIRNEGTGECIPACSPPISGWSPDLNRCVPCTVSGPASTDPILKVTKAGYVCQYNGATNGYTPVGQLSNGAGQTTIQSFVYPGQGGGYQAIPPQGVNSSVCAGF